jgi:hypothetical protein
MARTKRGQNKKGAVGGKNAVEREPYAMDLGGVYFTLASLGLWPEGIGGRPQLS